MMNRPSAINVLIVSCHADTRVAVSWMLRQSFPDALVSKAESIQEAMQTISAAADESPACVIVDAQLPEFPDNVTAMSESWWQVHVPTIVLEEASTLRSSDDSMGPGLTARIDRSTIHVRSLELAISKAIELATLSRQLEALEQELTSARDELAAGIDAGNQVQPGVSNKSTDSRVDRISAEPSDLKKDIRGDATAREYSSVSESPRLLKSGLEVSSEEERELAGRVQKDLMPPGSPLVEGFDIAGLSIPAETTGGDYYDYLPMADDLLCVSIGECSGRGLAPALLMASLRAYLRLLVTSMTDVSDVLSRANTLITEDIGDEEFIVTLMLIQIDCRTRSLNYASAGQQAFFFDRDGNVDVLHSTGMPLGLRDETVILEGASRKIRAGEILLLASDGVQKMMSDSGELFGTERMLELVKANRNLPSMIIANYLRKACTDFASPQFRGDDVTIVIVKGDDS